MAIAEAQAWVTSSSTGTPGSITATYGSTPTEGNLLIMCGRGTSLFSNASVSGSGWTLARQAFSTLSGSPIALWYKIAGAAEPTGVTLTWINSSNIAMFIGEYSGIHPTPLDGIVSVDSDNTTSLVKASGDLSTPTSYPYELCVAMIGHNGGLGTKTWSDSYVDKGTATVAVLTVATKVVTNKTISGATLNHTVSRTGGVIVCTFAGLDQHGLLNVL